MMTPSISKMTAFIIFVSSLFLLQIITSSPSIQESPASWQAPIPLSRHSFEKFITVYASCPVTEFAAFKYGKFLLPPRFLTVLSVPKMPARKQ